MGMTFEALTGILRMKTDQWVKPLNDAGSQLGKFSQAADRAFAGVRAAAAQVADSVAAARDSLIALTVAGGGVAVALTKLASNAEEAGSKFQFVFKTAADATGRALDNFAGRAGRSSFALREMAANVGAILGPMGFTSEKTGELSLAFSKLAVDLSSFFNVSERDAMQALQSGIVGETEPLRKFGVVLNEQIIQQEAYRLGLARTADEVQGMVKTQAVYSLIMRQTATAQGDAVRTQGSFANQLRRLRDTIMDVATIGGQALLPVATSTLQVFNELTGPVRDSAKSLAAWAAENQALIEKKTKEFWEAVADRMKRVADAARGLWSSFRDMLPTFAALGDRVGVVVSKFNEWYGKLPQGVRDLILLATTLGTIATVTGAIASHVPVIGGLLLPLTKLVNPMTALSAASKSIGVAWGVLGPVFSALGAVLGTISAPIVAVVAGVTALGALFYTAYQNSERFRAAIDGFVATVTGGFKLAYDAVAGFVTDGLNALVQWWTGGGAGAAGKSLQDAWVAFSVTVVESMMDGAASVYDWIMPALTQLGNYVLTVVWPMLKDFGAWVAETFVAAWQKAGEFFTDQIVPILQAAKVAFIEVQDVLVAFVGKALFSFGEWWAENGPQVIRVADKLWESLKNIADIVLTALKLAWEWFAEFSTNSLLPALKPVASFLSDVFIAVLNDLLAAFKFVLEAVEAVVDMFNGDFRRATALAQRMLAGLVDTVNYLLKGLRSFDDWMFGEGTSGLHGITKSMDEYAASLRAAAEAAEGELKVEVEAIAARKKAVADAIQMEKDRQAAAQAAAQAEASAQAQNAAATRQGAAGIGAGAALNGVQLPAAGPEPFATNKPEINAGQLANIGDVANAAGGEDVGGSAGGEDVGGSAGGDALDATKLKLATPKEIREAGKDMAAAMRESLKGIGDAALQEEVKNLARLRAAALAAVNAIAGTRGAYRDAAIGDAVAAQKAFENAYEAIENRGKQTYEQIKRKQMDQAVDAQKSADAVEEAGNKAVAAIDKVEKKAEELNGVADGGKSGKGGAGGSATGAAGMWQDLQQQGLTTITDMSNNLSAMFMAATSGISFAATNFTNYLSSIVDPVQKFDALIRNQEAQISGMAINLSNFGVQDAGAMAQAQKDLKDLKYRRQQAVAEEANARVAAENDRRLSYQKRKREQDELDREKRKEQNLDLTSILANGKVPPIVMNVTANDARQAVDNLEKEMKRRGYDRSGRKRLETT